MHLPGCPCHLLSACVLSAFYTVPVAFAAETGGAGVAAAVAAQSTTNAPAAADARSGAHDFDWEFGKWKTHLKRRLRPLTGSNEWVEYEGTTVVSEVMGGRANLVELDVQGTAGRIAGMSLRLYNPESRQWSLNFANVTGGTLSPPTVGEFRDGRGEFYAQETLRGRSILVRFVIFDVTPTSARFEQSFSDDGGKSWELNWIAHDTRASDGG